MAHFSLICPPDEARRRLQRLKDMGFDEVLIGSHYGELDDVERVREFVS